MQRILLACLVGCATVQAQSAKWQPAPGHSQIPLWPGTPAGRDSEIVMTYTKPVGGRMWNYIQFVSRPTVTVYSPTGTNTGAAVLVFPGGGYQILAIDLEGSEVCDWITAKGVTCVLVKYRVPNTGPTWKQACGCFRDGSSPPLDDAQRAISFVRYHAAEWHIDPHKIGVIGFSAGGHLVAATSNRFAKRSYKPVDLVDRESARPDFAIALYPGHLWIDHKLNPDIHVTEHTPPTFIVQAENDDVDNIMNSIGYYTALENAGVPAEIHVFAEGGHAFGLRHTEFPISDWPALAERWLQSIGMIR